jgi:hypothetical protein
VHTVYGAFSQGRRWMQADGQKSHTLDQRALVEISRISGKRRQSRAQRLKKCELLLSGWPFDEQKQQQNKTFFQS